MTGMVTVFRNAQSNVTPRDLNPVLVQRETLRRRANLSPSAELAARTATIAA